MKFFTSDLHLGHPNICAGVSTWPDKSECRQFPSVEAMDEEILESINTMVHRADELYILGDFSFGSAEAVVEYRKRIACERVYLIFGNHDKHIRKSAKAQSAFVWCKDYDTVSIRDGASKKHTLCMFHYSINGTEEHGVWDKGHHGSLHIFGHNHGTLPIDCVRGASFDIGWDVWRRPLDEIEVCRKCENARNRCSE